MIVTHLRELSKAFPGIQLNLLRGTRDEIGTHLKSGAAEVAIAESFPEAWDRLDTWPLFTEPFKFVCSRLHRFASRAIIAPDELVDERLLIGTTHASIAAALAGVHVEAGAPSIGQSIVAEQDCVLLIEANLGVGFLPVSATGSHRITCVPFRAPLGSRSICAFGVLGRQRSPACQALIRLLRSADWSAIGLAQAAHHRDAELQVDPARHRCAPKFHPKSRANLPANAKREISFAR